MDPPLILETSFLIDLERELGRAEVGLATGFIERHRDRRFEITFTTDGELAAGFADARRDRWEALTAPFHVVPWTPEVSWRYGRAQRYLQATGQMIGANDLWIAATALARGAPLVTGDHEHFGRVPGLEVVDYRDRP